tara:strand:+ start:997 stop:1137 length:141 start_codon:yes stop_codon:yes gene_type:complete
MPSTIVLPLQDRGTPAGPNFSDIACSPSDAEMPPLQKESSEMSKES